jgi:hypothetical protein
MIEVDVAHVIGFLVTILTLLGFGLAGLRWLRGWLRRYLLDPLHDVRTEVTPRDDGTERRNGSLHEMVTGIGTAVNTLEARFGDHLRYHGRYDDDDRPRGGPPL